MFIWHIGLFALKTIIYVLSGDKNIDLIKFFCGITSIFMALKKSSHLESFWDCELLAALAKGWCGYRVFRQLS